MTWKTYTAIAAFSALIGVVMVASTLAADLRGGPGSGDLVHVAFGAALGALGIWNAGKAWRHAQAHDPDPASFRDLVQRL
jgi:hypothetical protein